MNHLRVAALSFLLAIAASLNTEPGNKNHLKNIFEEECFERGRCTDRPLETLQNVATPKDCWSKCRNNRECNTFTHFAEAQECILFNSCDQILDTCDDCTHGRVTCVPLEGHRVVTFGGWKDSTSVYGYSLDSIDPLCKLPSLPEEASRKPFGAFINGNLTVCGGDMKSCYYLNKDYRKWEKSFGLQREHSSAISTFNNDIWTFFGGRPAGERDTISVWRQGQDFFETLDAPPEIGEGGCSTRFNDTHALFAKGSALVYWYQDQESSFERHEVPFGAREKTNSACGLAHVDNDVQFVIAGGRHDKDCLYSTGILSFNDQSWIEGPELPECRFGPAFVQFQNSFALLGGRWNDRPEDTAFFYEPIEGWIELPIKLSVWNAFHGAIGAYDTDISCK